MKKIFILLLTTIVLSCNPDDAHINLENDILGLSKRQLKEIQSKIENDIKKTKIKEIESIDVFGEIYIVNYKQLDDKTNAVAFENLILKQKGSDELTISTDYSIHCSGSCDCKIEGVLDENGGYAQCSCKDCVMHYSSKLQEKKGVEVKEIYNIENLAKKSFARTFKKNPKNLKVTKMNYKEYGKTKIYTFTYSDDENIPSTFMVVRDYKNPNTNYSSKTDGDFTVDCTGSCDCRERFYPATGAIECTCSPCSMVVKEIKKEEENGGGN